MLQFITRMILYNELNYQGEPFMCYLNKLVNFISTHANTLLLLSIAVLSLISGDGPPIS